MRNDDPRFLKKSRQFVRFLPVRSLKNGTRCLRVSSWTAFTQRKCSSNSFIQSCHAQVMLRVSTKAHTTYPSRPRGIREGRIEKRRTHGVVARTVSGMINHDNDHQSVLSLLYFFQSTNHKFIEEQRNIDVSLIIVIVHWHI